MSFCLSFLSFRLIDPKICRQLPFGPINTKQNFFALNPYPTKKGNFLGISITPEPFDGFSSKFQLSCLIPLHCFWEKILNPPPTQLEQWAIMQPLLILFNIIFIQRVIILIRFRRFRGVRENNQTNTLTVIFPNALKERITIAIWHLFLSLLIYLDKLTRCSILIYYMQD